MESLTLDPYEQQLLTVFDSYDHDNLGSLDRDGLTQLCQTLQLEEQGSDLIRCLLKDPKHSRATFPEFKDALLTLLGNMQHKNSETPTTKKIENGSPDREVSPKFVYGSKKYGRRSRPRNDELLNVVDEQNDLNFLNKTSNVSVQRSNSQTEVSNSKKRKTNYKLKRCTSLPGTQRIVDNSFVTTNNLTGNETEFVCTEEMLREAWKKLGVGEDGYLNQTELVLVCDAIGLHNLAKGVIRQLSNNLTLDFDHRISFQELLEALQQDETWSDVLDLDATPVSNDLSLTMTSNEIFPDSRTFQYVTLGPDGNGVINAESLIKMWELVGITSPKELIHELGFNDRDINIVELATVLEKEIKGLNDSDLQVQSPHQALLQANLTLYQSEIKCLKNILEQMHAEKEKLKCDVFEANNRAKMLAQEVDDNHLKMERNTQNQVKLLEQRHSEILKEITQQFTNDKEQLSGLNQSLEDKIASLEIEVGKLKNDIIVAQKYSNSLEKENQNLSGKITELHQVRDVLTDQINVLENEKQKYVEMEQEQMEPLLEKLSNLQLENAQLRDRNDEMVAEIENLTCQVSSMRNKAASAPCYNTLDQSMEENISVVCEGVGLGAKRRSDYSPSKDGVLFGIDGSPRLGKVPKFQKDREEHLDIAPFASNESGFEAEIDCFETSSASNSESEEINRLQAKIAFLEQILAQHSIPITADGHLEVEASSDIAALKTRVEELETIFRNLREVSKMINKNGLSCDNLKHVSEKLEKILNGNPQQKILNDASIETDDFDESIKKYEDENKQLIVKCTELENCVELLRNEYEKCEDYWQSKLDEERQIFEQEQSQSSEKLNDLIRKMSEYEEQFAIPDQLDNRLPPIEETYNLEQQFTDLEQEFEDYKIQSENEIFKRDEEIAILKQKLTELAMKQKENREISVQTNELSENSRISNTANNLSLCMVESTNIFSADAMPVNWSTDEPPVQKTERDYVNPSFVWNKDAKSDENSSATSMSWQNSQGQASTSNSSTLEKHSAPCRPKRTRKHDRSNCLYKKNNQDVKKTDSDGFVRREEQVVTLPLSTVHGLNGRLHHLEQRCRQLQMVLKQQHFYTEQALQQCRQHHRGEKAELQCILRSHQEKLDQQVRICNEQLERLARSDMLVKELYVENSYLIAKVQRLEQQCHILVQCNANSSSV